MVPADSTDSGEQHDEPELGDRRAVQSDDGDRVVIQRYDVWKAHGGPTVRRGWREERTLEPENASLFGEEIQQAAEEILHGGDDE